MHRFVYTHGDKSPEKRVLLTPVIAKGQFYPLTQKHGSISKKFVVRIDAQSHNQNRGNPCAARVPAVFALSET